ncbi:MAG: 4-alpha-glucanotransferase [Actinobacteria bacterium]|nr:4-alpha-glucanotransferase [Actinomycetota bacterium]
MIDRRASGILLHPTSLPGPYGIGDLGPAAVKWLDWLAASGCRYWQMLPSGPTGYGDSPYQCFSAYAGNPMLISPDLLIEDGLIDTPDHPEFPDDRVDYGAVIPWKSAVLDAAFDCFRTAPAPDLYRAHAAFREQHRAWLEDYALFMAIKEDRGGGPWWEWPDELRMADEKAVAVAAARLGLEVERQMFRQFLFFRQWDRLRRAASQRGIEIIGDIPIFVAPDSVDVWADPHLFHLDDRRRPTVVAGVPPDYFSENGQLWGNPLYDWAAHAADGYAWWIERIRHTVAMVDVVRIDHFRGFVDYWAIPAGSPTAAKGRWMDGPGRALFDAIETALGDLPIIAEDLGELHAAVPVLRDELGLPGMKILQFAYDGDPKNDFLPARYPENCLVYTGTHDNDTVLGWYRSVPPAERIRARRALRACGPATTIPHRMIEEAWRSRAIVAITTLQDVLSLGTGARMNIPSTPSGNWRWRFGEDDLTDRTAGWLRKLNRKTGRG